MTPYYNILWYRSAPNPLSLEKPEFLKFWIVDSLNFYYGNGYYYDRDRVFIKTYFIVE